MNIKNLTNNWSQFLLRNISLWLLYNLPTYIIYNSGYSRCYEIACCYCGSLLDQKGRAFQACHKERPSCCCGQTPPRTSSKSRKLSWSSWKLRKIRLKLHYYIKSEQKAIFDLFVQKSKLKIWLFTFFFVSDKMSSGGVNYMCSWVEHSSYFFSR